jgi:hypothetical protein
MSQSQSIKSRGQWVFAKMASIYGARFLDMWRDINQAEAETMWTQAMHGMSDDAIRRGLAKLFHTPHPPTLPEWLELCRAEPAMYRAPALTDEANRTPPAEARKHLAAIAARLGSCKPGIAWARKIVDEAANGHILPGNRLQVALDAIKNFEGTHGTAKAQEPEVPLPPRVPSPHIYEPDREPGSDDDLEVV